MHTGHIINRNKGLWVLAVDKVHQLLILVFVHDGNDLVVLFKVVCTDGLVHGGTAVQVIDDELPQRLLLLGNDAHPALDAVIEDEMVQHDDRTETGSQAHGQRLRFRPGRAGNLPAENRRVVCAGGRGVRLGRRQLYGPDSPGQHRGQNPAPHRPHPSDEPVVEGMG